MASNRNPYRGLIYVAAFVFPFFGVAYGMLEAAKPELENRRRGKTCVILGIVATMLVCVGSVVWVAVGLQAGFASLFPG